jgi:hypothetical protein
LGPLEEKPAAGVEVAEKVQGLDWFQSKTENKASVKLTGALSGFFSAALDIEAAKIASVEAEGFTHQQVVNPEKLLRGYAYLWETVEASKIRIKLDSSLEGAIEGKIDKFASSALGKKASLQFKPVSGAAKGTYEVIGRNLVVAVKVVNFEMRTGSETVTLKLGRDSQSVDQPGAFGYAIAVQANGVNLPERKVEVILRNQQLADSDTGTMKRTLSSATARLHSGPVIGEGGDCAVDSAYVSAWDTQNLACQVTFQRTTWELKQVGCGLETAK